MDYDTLVLPGGGIKGIILLGGIQYLIDNYHLKNIKNFIGTSIGSIINYLLILGYTPIEILIQFYSPVGSKLLEKLKYLDLIAMINGNGATSFTPLYEALEFLTLQKTGKLFTLSSLKEKYGKNLILTTYNMTTCMTEYLESERYPDLPCLTAIRMSCNIPLVFDRFKYMDNYYVDGGISDNFPIVKGKEIGEKILGLNLVFSNKNMKDEPSDGMIVYFMRLLYIPIIQSINNRIDMVKENCTIINLDSGPNNFFEFDVKSKSRLEMFSIGYNSVKNFLNNK